MHHYVLNVYILAVLNVTLNVVAELQNQYAFSVNVNVSLCKSPNI